MSKCLFHKRDCSNLDECGHRNELSDPVCRTNNHAPMLYYSTAQVVVASQSEQHRCKPSGMVKRASKQSEIQHRYLALFTKISSLQACRIWFSLDCHFSVLLSPYYNLPLTPSSYMSATFATSSSLRIGRFGEKKG